MSVEIRVRGWVEGLDRREFLNRLWGRYEILDDGEFFESVETSSFTGFGSRSLTETLRLIKGLEVEGELTWEGYGIHETFEFHSDKDKICSIDRSWPF